MLYLCTEFCGSIYFHRQCGDVTEWVLIRYRKPPQSLFHPCTEPPPACHGKNNSVTIRQMVICRCWNGQQTKQLTGAQAPKY